MPLFKNIQFIFSHKTVHNSLVRLLSGCLARAVVLPLGSTSSDIFFNMVSLEVSTLVSLKGSRNHSGMLICTVDLILTQRIVLKVSGSTNFPKDDNLAAAVDM